MRQFRLIVLVVCDLQDRRIEVQISTQTLEMSSDRDLEGDLRNGKESMV